MLLWLFLPLASGWWWEGRDEKYKAEKRVEQEDEDYLEEYRGDVALERMDLGEYAYYYYEYPEDRQAGVLLIFNPKFNSFLPNLSSGDGDGDGCDDHHDHPQQPA